MPKYAETVIKEAFIALLEEEPLNRITVKDIVQKSGLNRNSFYYHFHDIVDLTEQIVEDTVQTVIDEHPTVDSIDEACETALALILKNKKVVFHIYHSGNRAIFEQALLRLCEYAVSVYVSSAAAVETLTREDRALLVRFLKYETFGMYISWLDGGMKEEEMEDICRLTKLARVASHAVLTGQITL